MIPRPRRYFDGRGFLQEDPASGRRVSGASGVPSLRTLAATAAANLGVTGEKLRAHGYPSGVANLVEGHRARLSIGQAFRPLLNYCPTVTTPTVEGTPIHVIAGSQLQPGHGAAQIAGAGLVNLFTIPIATVQVLSEAERQAEQDLVDWFAYTLGALTGGTLDLGRRRVWPRRLEHDTQYRNRFNQVLNRFGGGNLWLSPELIQALRRVGGGRGFQRATWASRDWIHPNADGGLLYPNAMSD